MTIKTNMMILLILLGLFSIAPGTTKSACAQATAGGGTIAAQTCDTQVWQTMAARAQLETEREVMQNQNLIFKADSILDYTCFDSFAAHASKNIGVLFTHTTYFNGAQIIQWGMPYGMDNAMQTVVMGSMVPYLQANFGHALLGGRGDSLGLPRHETQPIGAQGRNYGCNVMNQVWMAAKCMNFLHTQDFAATDGFYPFINLTPTDGGQAVDGYETKKDIRQYPTPCGNSTPILGSTWQDEYRLSRNERQFGTPDALYPFGTPLMTAFREVRDLVKPGACGPAIPTGIQIILGPGDAQPYPDGVCTNPGCSYQRGGKCSTDGPGGGGIGGAAP